LSCVAAAAARRREQEGKCTAFNSAAF